MVDGVGVQQRSHPLTLPRYFTFYYLICSEAKIYDEVVGSQQA